ncbi:MAG: PDZ domain-containing protein [Acidimicrobiia bacterium]|nr:PDZ domain-containing protein [Acidimicrobiia bacterium]
MTPRKEVGAPRWVSMIIATFLFASGIGVGWLITSNPDDFSISAPTTTETTEPSTTTSPDFEAINQESSVEPVAKVAERLLPSVVSIRTGAGQGSGVIYDSDGLIMTAAHVVEGSSEVEIQLSDGTTMEGTVLGGNIATDIAVVQVEESDLPAAELAVEEQTEVGELAVAVGSPLGLDSTVTSGVISAVNQTVTGRYGPRTYVQTDASINPGNSGGALANREGQVIGINVMIFSVSGGSDGVGFAVPIDIAAALADRIVEGGEIGTAYLGVSAAPSEVDGVGGVTIAEVGNGTPAAEAGIQPGDVITAIGGQPVTDYESLAATVRSYLPGNEIELTIERDGEETMIVAVLAELPDSDS